MELSSYDFIFTQQRLSEIHLTHGRGSALRAQASACLGACAHCVDLMLTYFLELTSYQLSVTDNYQ